MIYSSAEAALHLQLTQYAQDFQALLGRHTELERRHENLQASPQKSSDTSRVLRRLNPSLDDLCLVMDARGHIQYASDNARAWLAFVPGQTPALQALLTPSDRLLLERLLLDMASATDTSFERLDWKMHPAGEPGQARRMEVLCLTIAPDSGPCAYLVIRDLQEGGDVDTATMRSSTRRKNAHQGLLVTDFKGDTLAIEPAFLALTGFERSDLEGQKFGLLGPGRGSSTFYGRFWAELKITGQWSGEVSILHKDDTIVRHWLSATALKDEGDKTCTYVFAFADLDQMISAERALLNATSQDKTSGLSPLALFCEQADEKIASARHGGASVTVLQVTLDELQWHHDAQDSHCAEAFFIAASRHLQDLLRGRDLMARVGFNQLAVLLVGNVTETTLNQITQRIKDKLPQAIAIATGRKTWSSGISIDIVRFPVEGIDARMLPKNADAA